uniref:Uncharacterized protein n=1 Tax=Vertebrata isogona TaxID=2006944 RepID=A0A1Z1MFQ1_9FLOR|nr:hypothetical protein [Vertebrata isogona]ARW64645.1 hypothetical protein [Vertebrata isogona]
MLHTLNFLSCSIIDDVYIDSLIYSLSYFLILCLNIYSLKRYYYMFWA